VASGQSDVIAFLSELPGVERIETHAAIVFLTGDKAYKIKKAVKFPFLDFSTLELRRAALARELEINRPAAPQIYRGLEPVAREASGRLEIGGKGEPVEWVLVMNRFDREMLLDRIAARGPLDPALAKALADATLAAHAAAPVATEAGGAAPVQSLIDQLAAAFADHAVIFGREASAEFRRRAGTALERADDCLQWRARHGFVRRCHGDLHLRNIVLIEGRPVLFDALEFSERLATIDVLYDLAFLLMDLIHRAQRRAANLVLNRYLQGAREPAHEKGLIALPLFLSIRAGVRALVDAERVAQAAGGEESLVARARIYLASALADLDPEPPRLIAIGGFSGTGKSTVAAALAPSIGAAPGAVHLRSDIERKALFGVAETERLGAAAYGEEATVKVYAAIYDRARRIVEAGHSAVADAVFARRSEREAIERVAAAAAIPFAGLWLGAPPAELSRRVAARHGDASDATPEIVELQIARGAEDVEWAHIDASRPLDEVVEQARGALRTSDG
jgi:aminoglycoside phosphotransferase family enzyme/predicted kinase